MAHQPLHAVRLAAVAALLLVAGCAPAAPGQGGTTAASSPVASPVSKAAASPVTLERVSLSLASIAQSQAQYLIAREKGYYREEGIEVDVQVTAPNVGVQGTVAGTFDITGVGGQAAVARMSGPGVPLKLVFNHNLSVTWWLMAAKNSGVTSIADLRGKSIAVEGPGTLSSTFMRAVLKKHGINPDTEVQFVNAGPVANWLTPVLSGAVHAGIAGDSDKYIVAKREGLIEITRIGTEINAPLSGLATTEATLSTRADMVKRFVKASVKGLRFYLNKKEESVAILAPVLKQEVAETVAAYDVLAPLTAEVPKVGTEAQREFIDLVLTSLNKEPGTVSPEDVFDYKLLDQALKELDAEGWVPK